MVSMERRELRPNPPGALDFLVSAFAGRNLPPFPTAWVPAAADETGERTDRLRNRVLPVLTAAVKYLETSVHKSKRRFACLGYALTWWCGHCPDVCDGLRRLGVRSAALRLDRMSNDLLGDACAVMAVTARKGRTLFERERRAHRRPRIAGNASAVRKAHSAARSRTRELVMELQLVGNQLADRETHIAQNVADHGKAMGQKRKPGRPRKSKRGKAKVLTGPQEAVVASLEEFKLTVADVAKQRGCTDKAVYAIYGRAKKNPGYKKRRSVNLNTATPLHANTLPKGGERDDQ